MNTLLLAATIASLSFSDPVSVKPSRPNAAPKPRTDQLPNLAFWYEATWSGFRWSVGNTLCIEGSIERHAIVRGKEVRTIKEAHAGAWAWYRSNPMFYHFSAPTNGCVEILIWP